MLLMVKADVKIIIMNETKIMGPMAMKKVLLQRDHWSHNVQNKMSNSIRIKYFWPGIKGDVKKTVEA